MKIKIVWEETDKMRVKLLEYTPEPEKLVAAAAKFCYSGSGVDDIMEGLDEKKTASYVEMIAQLGHSSIMEHASFTFGIEGVSRSLLAQITRHRIASFSVQSQRYVRENMFEYVMPPQIEADEAAKAEFIKAMEEDQRHYEKITEILKQKHKAGYIKEGMTEKAADSAAEKQAIEDARFVLPNACTTKIMMTMNCRSLQNFFSLRCCNRAQWEIRALAQEMFRLVYAVAPHVFVNAGPTCVNGGCGEGKMTCGRADEMREIFENLRSGAGKQEKSQQ
jgi:thymidylate synthase (FAD)